MRSIGGWGADRYYADTLLPKYNTPC